MIFKILDKQNQYKDYKTVILRIIFLYSLISSLFSKIYTHSYAKKFSKSLIRLDFTILLFFSYLGLWSILIGFPLAVIWYKIYMMLIALIIPFLVALISYYISKGNDIRERFSSIMLLLLGYFFLINGERKSSINN